MNNLERSNENTPQTSGTLFIVATPIGNKEDITLRAIATLSQVDRIAAEDTRHSGLLLQSLGIKAKMIALHDHNEVHQSDALIHSLQSGLSIALISDAGTPLINDPGYHLVKKCHEQQIKVVPIPGPCAAITALSASGLPTHSFRYEGFLPAKASHRMAHLESLRNDPATLIFYESTHRIIPSLTDMATCFGKDRLIVLAKELTKQWETIRQSSIASLLDWMAEDERRQKGEFVLIVAGNTEIDGSSEDEIKALELVSLLQAELPLKKACAIAATHYHLKKNKLYQTIIDKNQPSDSDGDFE